ncbi:RNase P/RNase MRP subunit POP5 [Halorhabdus sp. SVX81]|uniref:Rpp14/Pop5 family protein n=1 Tax=Halorhabdus sp. SVX81 TaxID=2978283 RepID=UPI0023D9A781|nr:Rpp14/Pop5 family protein [Halorhabdus sp. SVX81]WEL17939.1 RNase P/RNase MRP subunit POP5 [Halorhabdus sp. SVX81]
MKHLPKHFRQRWRYLAVELETWSDADFDRGAFQRHLWFAAQNLLGDVGSAAVDLSVVRFERVGPTGTAIIRTRRGEVSQARAVLATLESVDEDPVGLRVRGVSGTVRACEEKYLRGRPEPTEHDDVAFAGTDRPAVIRAGRVDVHVDDGFVGATQRDLS